MPTRTAFVEYALKALFLWYKWGGDDPSGFDCSGLVIECLKAFGLFPRKQDTTAEGLRIMFKEKEVPNPVEGGIAFWLNPQGKAYHTEISINSWQSVGASGGGSNTKTIQDAINHNAFIKIRPIHSRQPSGSWLFVDPWKEGGLNV